MLKVWISLNVYIENIKLPIHIVQDTHLILDINRRGI